jgi:hypothetical protein
MFVVFVAVVAVVFGFVVVSAVRGDGKKPGSASRDRPALTAPPGVTAPGGTARPGVNEVPLPSGQEHDDTQPNLSGGPTGPLELPPRWNQPPGPPLVEEDLKVATDRAYGFLEVFANGRWNDKPEDQIARIGQFVPKAQLDTVLGQYQRVRPKVEAHEQVTYRVTGARWIFLGEKQATLSVSGERTVRGDAGTRTGRLGFYLTLVKGSGGWQVTSARDPSEGDDGQR